MDVPFGIYPIPPYIFIGVLSVLTYKTILKQSF